MEQWEYLNKVLNLVEDLFKPSESQPKKHCPECIPSYGVNCSCCNCEGEK